MSLSIILVIYPDKFRSSRLEVMFEKAVLKELILSATWKNREKRNSEISLINEKLKTKKLCHDKSLLLNEVSELKPKNEVIAVYREKFE